MALQVRGVGECLGAITAHVRPLPGVREHVLSEIGCFVERFRTDRAGIRSLSRVDRHVLLGVTLEQEHPATHCAHVRFQPIVDEQMPLEPISSLKRFATQIAQEESLCAVIIF